MNRSMECMVKTGCVGILDSKKFKVRGLLTPEVRDSLPPMAAQVFSTATYFDWLVARAYLDSPTFWTGYEALYAFW